jgi:predicted enzyme related to lactoylglutathione lyase
MISGKAAFSGFSVKDQTAAKQFYEDKLGLSVSETPMGLQLHVGGGNPVFLYQKEDHVPASFTILNFQVDDIDAVVTELKDKGIHFEQYAGLTDEQGVARGIAQNRGPDIAWFKDPSGNILSVLQEG